MAETKYDVVGIGNAIVDVIARAEDDFLVTEDLVKGSMNLIDEVRADTLYEAMGAATEMSGGSGANTIAGLASFGGRGAFFGKIAEDGLKTTLLGRSWTIWGSLGAILRPLGPPKVPRKVKMRQPLTTNTI